MSKVTALMNRYMGWDVLTAEFREPHTAAAAEHFDEILRRVVPILAMVGLAMTLAFWPLDAIISKNRPAVVDAFFNFRMVSLGCCLGLLVAVRWVGPIRRRPLLGTMVMMILFSSSSGWVLGGAHDLRDPVFWVWMMVCFLLLVMPMRLGVRILAHTGTLGGFAIAFMSRQDDLFAQETFGVAVTMLISTLFLSISMGNLVSALSRRSFRQARELEAARAESENLLLSVLPAAVAKRLKRDRNAIADRYEMATVMFADLVGFTVLAKEQDPAETVAMLNRIFSAFDELTERHGVEKIKTIGDAYMVVGGVPVAHPGHAIAICDLGLAMMECIAQIARDADVALKLRIGIHSGPVVAGVIGSQKLSYDVWGDTVNTASRMESHGVADAIHVTQEVATLIGDDFRCEERGPIDVKSIGSMRTMFVRGRR